MVTPAVGDVDGVAGVRMRDDADAMELELCENNSEEEIEEADGP